MMYIVQMYMVHFVEFKDSNVILYMVRLGESMHRLSIDASILHQRCINKDYYPVDQRCIDYRADRSMMHRLYGRHINDASII